jgi:two-component system, OmpR family, sensor histidine kinase BaeS
MRLRLVHTLSLLLLAAVLLAVLAMGAVMAWNLRKGFADYLAARDAERLVQFADMVGELAEQAGGLAAVQQQDQAMHRLLDQFAQRQGLVLRQSIPLTAGPDATAASQARHAAMPAGPPSQGADGFGARVAVVSVEGQTLMGRHWPPQLGPFTDRPIRVKGAVVALARLRAASHMPDGVESRFLQSQYLGILSVAAVLFLMALGSAWCLARRWARPLLAVQDATARIAQGELNVRIDTGARGSSRSDEIGDVVRNINQMADGLQRLESGRRRWVANISHELRTPLAVLRGEIDALIDGIRPLRAEAMFSLQEETLRLSALVDDLHLLAISDLQALPCQFAHVDAAAWMQQQVQRFTARAAAAGLSLHIHLNTPAPMAVCWDSSRIEQLMSNLLENSLRYTDAPGRVVWAMKREGDQVVIDINDSAPGVPAEALPHLFEPLYRADTARSRLHGGSGLGLSICVAIVRSHGGQIQAAPSALGGLSVCIQLPVNPHLLKGQAT